MELTIKEENEQLQKELDALKQKYETVAKENKQLKEEKLLSAPQYQSHSDEFWRKVDDKCKYDADYIKTLIKNKEITMFDTNKTGYTLLIIAARRGCYEIVQLCINLGANIDHIDNNGKTALINARESGYYQIEQLLLFSKMNATIGNKIKVTADIINKQNGINENISKQLSMYKKMNQKAFKDTLMNIMINILSKKLSFSDDLLNLCWQFVCKENKNILSSKLWLCIKKVCTDIIQNTNEKDWFYMKTFIIPSQIWFKEIGVDENDIKEEPKTEGKLDDDMYYLDNIEKPKKIKRHLFYELLKIVETQGKKQLNELKEQLWLVENKNKNNWNKLTEWDIGNDITLLPKLPKIINKNNEIITNIRQDNIPNGIESQYTFSHLLQHSGSSSFNAYKFYDYNEYLSEMILLANMIDNEFQKSVQNIFGIDKYTKIGKIDNSMYINYENNDDEGKYDNGNYTDTGSQYGSITYLQGPVKLIERAKFKSENDYSHEAYPTTSCIIDFNRCTLIFNDIETLLNALQVFKNKVKYYQSGNIIGILRCKNGFKDYIKETQYSDIKLNVLVKGKTNNIIAEIQFLLDSMMDFKHKAHNLYSIQRQEQYMEYSVSLILPVLLNEDKKMFIAAKHGGVKQLCELMVINNKTEKDILKIDGTNNQTILHTICLLGQKDAFLFLQSILTKQSFITYLFATNNRDQKPIEFALRNEDGFIAKYLLDIGEIKQKYINNNDELFRLLYWLFAHGKNELLVDYILNILNISIDKINDIILNHKYHKTSVTYAKDCYKYDKYTIIARTIERNKTLNGLKKLVSVIGDKTFIEGILISDGWNINGIEYAIKLNKIKMLKFIMSFKDIKNKYLHDDDECFRLIYYLFVECKNENMIDYIIKELNLSNEEIIRFVNYEYSKQNDDIIDKDDKYNEYCNYGIVFEAVSKNKLNIIKKMVSIIGGNVFVYTIMKSNNLNEYIFEILIQKNKLEIMQYIIGLTGIRNKILKNKEILMTIVWWLSEKNNELMVKYMLNMLELNEIKLKQLQSENDQIDDNVIKNLLRVLT